MTDDGILMPDPPPIRQGPSFQDFIRAAREEGARLALEAAARPFDEGWPKQQQCPAGDRLVEHVQGLCVCNDVAAFIRALDVSRILEGKA